MMLMTDPENGTDLFCCSGFDDYFGQVVQIFGLVTSVMIQGFFIGKDKVIACNFFEFADMSCGNCGRGGCIHHA